MARFSYIGLVGTFVLVLTGCQTTAGLDDRRITEAELLSGKAIFGEVVASNERPDIDILGADDAMRAFVADLPQISNKASRFHTLLDRIRGGGYVGGYDPYANLSARDAFAEKRGNCLSYTNLFIALAREAGLDANYQLIDVPPDYDSINGLVVLIKHVNVRVEDIPGRGSVTVEFSGEYGSGVHDRRVVGDRFAHALHYNNLALSDGLTGDERGSLVYLRKAIENAPDHPDFWTNLGVFYARRGHFDHAIAGYRRALDIDTNHRSAIRGLANAYGALGRAANAQFYQRRMARSRIRDAYIYYTLAHRAYEVERPTESLELVSNAIRLHRRDHRFYILQGEVHDRLGNAVAADESFKRARTLARDDKNRKPQRLLHERYPRLKAFVPGRSTILFRVP